MNKDKALSNVGQGFNDQRGEIDDKKDTPKHNGQNVNNDPAHHRGNEGVYKSPVARKKVENN